MNLSAVIVGTDKWHEYTKPLIDSMRIHNPDVSVVCVDNGSQYPDYDATMVRTNKVLSYPEALNVGLQACDASDWYLVLNNDILIRKPFGVEDFDPGCLYGFIKYPFIKYEYLAGWAMFIPYEAIVSVGYFDEELKPMWFEDADYCIRAQKAGFGLVELNRVEFGIHHIEDENMDERKRYMQENMPSRQRNRLYVERKHGL